MGMGDGVVEALAVEDDRRAVARGLSDLHRGGEARHDDRRRNAEPPRVIGEALRVIAGRRRDDAARERCSASRLRSLLKRTALLVGGGELQVLELEPDLRAGQVSDSVRLWRHGVRITWPAIAARAARTSA